jgi:phage anti-repressor protein/predicted GIY-YIG superfamily endonuclease
MPRIPVKERLTKKDIVKLFTTIPNDFVDDFYDLLERTEDNAQAQITAFPIDLGLVCKWLDVHKNKMVVTLKKTYKEREDYIVTKAQVVNRPENRGGHNRRDYFLTLECFKHICMRSSSKKGTEVRTYFIELDNFVTRYTREIVEGLLKKLNTVEKKARNDGSGWIYIFRAKGSILKIGQTQDLIDRLRTYNTGRVDDVELLASFKTDHRKKAEDCVKTFVKAKRYKKRRELYEVDDDIIKRVMGMCTKIGDIKLASTEQWKAKDSGLYYMIFAENSA